LGEHVGATATHRLFVQASFALQSVLMMQPMGPCVAGVWMVKAAAAENLPPRLLYAIAVKRIGEPSGTLGSTLKPAW